MRHLTVDPEGVARAERRRVVRIGVLCFAAGFLFAIALRAGGAL